MHTKPEADTKSTQKQTTLPGKHEHISLSPPSPGWPPSQADPPFLPIHQQSHSSSFPCLLLFVPALSHVSGKDLTLGILRMFSNAFQWQQGHGSGRGSYS